MELDTMLHTLRALDVPEYDCFCQDCGKRAGTRQLVTPPKDGFVLVRCFDCSAGDRPTERPETGFGG
jgi:hypothetical protein